MGTTASAEAADAAEIERNNESFDHNTYNGEVSGLKDAVRVAEETGDDEEYRKTVESAKVGIADVAAQEGTMLSDRAVSNEDFKSYIDAINALPVDATPAEITAAEKAFADENPKAHKQVSDFWEKCARGAMARFEGEITPEVNVQNTDTGSTLAELAKNPSDVGLKIRLDESLKELTKRIDALESLSDKIDETATSSKWKTALKFFGPLKYAITIGLGVLFIWLLLKSIADGMTGCYKYTTNGDGTKTDTEGPLVCPPKGDYNLCRCARNPGDSNLVPGDCEKAENQPYAPCCAAQGKGGSFCVKTPGQDNSIYYAYQQVSPGELAHDIFVGLGDALKALGANLSSVLKTILIAAGIIIGLIILFLLVTKVIIPALSKNK